MSYAQPLGRTYDSVEWMAVEAPVIAAGVIESVDHATDRAVDVKLNVSEMLKGASRESLVFRVHVGHASRERPKLARLVRHHESGSAVLVFLTHIPGAEFNSTQYRPIPWVWLGDRLSIEALFAQSDDLVFAQSGARPSYHQLKTMESKSIADYEELLAATRLAVRQEALLRPWDSIGGWAGLTPGESVAAGGGITPDFRIPYDERLEALGKEWLKSEDSHARHHGVWYLGWFRSPENQRLLETQLAELSADEDENAAVIATVNNVLREWAREDEMDLSELAEFLSTAHSGRMIESHFKRACRVAGFRGKSASELIPILETLDSASELWVRRAAAETINKITEN